ncbi:MAG: hypothetical protein WCK93_13120 [Nitrosomonadales bacterium]
MATKTVGQIIKEMPTGVFTTLEKTNPIGALQARKQSNGTVSLFWRYSIGAKSERVSIGVYDVDAPPRSLQPTAKGFSVLAAIHAAQALAQVHHANRAIGGRPALIAAKVEAIHKAAKAEAEAAEEAEAAKLQASTYTLKNLLNHYCDHLESLSRRSHGDARSIFKLHVYEAWPKIAALPANKVTGEQVADMMRGVVENGKGRTANKLRSYIRAAYQTALAARSKASIPLHFKPYRVTSNPGADTVPDESENKADKNPLSTDEMRLYWQTIKPMPGFIGAVLRLHLLTGGQRIEQLVKLKTSDVNSDSITLYDSKGRPGKSPRPHTVPLIPLAAAALFECKLQGTYAISTDIDGFKKDGTETHKGDTHLAATTLSKWAVEAVKGMTIDSGSQGIPNFKTKRIRSGVETLLASARISKEMRGRLQSHGISGVQDRHYDGHEYMDDKRQALMTLIKLLDGPGKTNVIAFKTG